MSVEYRTISPETAEWRFTNGEDQDGTFEGYLSIFGVTDSHGTRMMKGCWNAGGLDPTRVYPLLDMHSADSVVRSVLGGYTAQEDDKGLYIKGRYAATAAGQDARTLAGMGLAPELSVGFVRRGSLEDDANALTVCELVEGSQIIKGFASTPGAELVSVRKREERAWPPVVGSFEDTTNKLREAARAWAVETLGLGDDDKWWVGVEATFADFVVVVVERYGDEPGTTYFRFPWSGDDEVTLGEPVEVEVVSDIKERLVRPTGEVRRKLALARLLVA